MQTISFILKFISYKLFSKHKKAYGIHSPFLFKLISETFNSDEKLEFTQKIDSIRNSLLKSSEKITVNDIGAGSKTMKSFQRNISKIAKYSAVKKKYGELLSRIIIKFEPKTILELGTSVGLSTLYLAFPKPESIVHTIEFCPETAKKASQNFKIAETTNIVQHIGNIDEILPQLINETENFDFVFFDANHKELPTLKYFNLCLANSSEKSIFVFDDIHWSNEMERAWEKIKIHEKVTLTVDLFFFGIVFFDKNLSKENFIVKY
jgi:predicted O-methyltransferase YrrM